MGVRLPSHPTWPTQRGGPAPTATVVWLMSRVGGIAEVDPDVAAVEGMRTTLDRIEEELEESPTHTRETARRSSGRTWASARSASRVSAAAQRA